MKERLLKEIQKGSKSATMKKHVITYLIYNENATITDLSKSMNLSIPTVTKVIDEMHEEGYIDEYGKLETSGGRHPILYGLNADSGYFIGVDLKWDSLNIGIINFKGDLLKLQMGIPFQKENTMDCVEELCKGEFYQFNLSSCIRQQNSLTAQFVSFSLANLANIFYPPDFYNN